MGKAEDARPEYTTTVPRKGGFQIVQGRGPGDVLEWDS